MKFLICFLVLVLLPFADSYGQTSASLEGTWLISFNETLELHSAEDRQAYEDMDEAAKTMMADQMNGQQFTFQSDNRFSTTLYDGRSFEGAYSLDNNGQLTLKYDAGMEVSQQIIEVSSTTLILDISNSVAANAVIKKLYLEKE